MRRNLRDQRDLERLRRGPGADLIRFVLGDAHEHAAWADRQREAVRSAGPEPVRRKMLNWLKDWPPDQQEKLLQGVAEKLASNAFTGKDVGIRGTRSAFFIELGQLRVEFPGKLGSERTFDSDLKRLLVRFDSWLGDMSLRYGLAPMATPKQIVITAPKEPAARTRRPRKPKGITEREWIEGPDCWKDATAKACLAAPHGYVTSEEVAKAWRWPITRVRRIFQLYADFPTVGDFGSRVLGIPTTAIPKARQMVLQRTGERVPIVKPPAASQSES